MRGNIPTGMYLVEKRKIISSGYAVRGHCSGYAIKASEKERPDA
jgi:hypothetical protein